MGVYRMQGPPPPTYQQQGPTALDQLSAGINEGMGQGLETAVGEYYETQKQKKSLGGAADILGKLGKDYELEDILTMGKQMGQSPDAIQAALHVGQAGQKGRLERQKLTGMAKTSEQQKAAYKTYNDYLSVGNDSMMVGKDLEGLQKHMESLGDKMGSPQAKVAGWLPDAAGKHVEPAWAKEYNTRARNLIARYKDIFKNRITDTDLKLILKLIPDASLNKEQNQSIINAHKAIIGKYIFRAQQASDIHNKLGDVPVDFQNQIFDKMKNYEEEADNAVERVYELGVPRPEGEEGPEERIIDTPQGKFKVDEAGYKKYQADQKRQTMGDPEATTTKMRVNGKVFSVPASEVAAIKNKFPGSEVLQ